MCSTISASAGRQKSGLPYRLEGAERDANDPDLLRATSTGQPVLLRDSVKVEPVIKTPG